MDSFRSSKYILTFLSVHRVEPVRLTFMVVGAAMGGLGLMILFVGCLSTGATRARVYTTWRGRVGGRISCVIVSTHTIVCKAPSTRSNYLKLVTNSHQTGHFDKLSLRVVCENGQFDVNLRCGLSLAV